MLKLFKFVTLSVVAFVFAASVSTVSVNADEVSDWRRNVAVAVVKKQKYPRSAISRNIEGTAKVKVTVARDGSIASYEVVEATGENILDREIEKTMERVSSVPAPSAGIGDGDLTFIIPIVWRLS